MNVWTYWEDKKEKPRTTVVDLCLKSLEKNLGATVVTPEWLQGQTGGDSIWAKAQGVPIPQRSDLIRLWLIHEFGGIWVDADSIALGPIDPRFIQLCESKDLAGVFNKGTKGKDLLSTPFGAPAGSPAIAFALDECWMDLEKIRDGTHVPYGKTSVGLLSKIWEDHRSLFNIGRVEHWRLNRIPWNVSHHYSFRGTAFRHKQRRHQWTPLSTLYHLTGKVMDQHKAWTKDQLMESDTLLSFLFQRAFPTTPGFFPHALAILKRLPKGPVHGTEVGVFTGKLSQDLLSRPDLHLTMIDPWAHNPSPEYHATGDFHKGFAPCDWQDTMKSLHTRLAFAKDRTIFKKGFSYNELPTLKNRSMDFIFLDGDHSLKGVTEDLAQSFPKIKPGGWLCGHDYDMASVEEGGTHKRKTFKQKDYGVKEAVDNLVRERGLKIELDKGNTFFIQV